MYDSMIFLISLFNVKFCIWCQEPKWGVALDRGLPEKQEGFTDSVQTEEYAEK